MRLTEPMRDLLWQVAQHQYGWTHVARYGGQLQVADGLVRRGLVEWGRNGRDHPDPRVIATDAGREEIGRRYPVSPFVLGTYEHQPGGWTSRDAYPENLMDDGMSQFVPGINCLDCGRFVGRNGYIGIEHYEMSSTVASIEGQCRRCLDAECDREIRAEHRHLTELVT